MINLALSLSLLGSSHDMPCGACIVCGEELDFSDAGICPDYLPTAYLKGNRARKAIQ